MMQKQRERYHVTSFSNCQCFVLLLLSTDLFYLPCSLHLFSLPTISPPEKQSPDPFLSSKLLVGFCRDRSPSPGSHDGGCWSPLFPGGSLFNTKIDCLGSKKGQGRGERKGQTRRWAAAWRCRNGLSGRKREGYGQFVPGLPNAQKLLGGLGEISHSRGQERSKESVQWKETRSESQEWVCMRDLLIICNVTQVKSSHLSRLQGLPLQKSVGEIDKLIPKFI